jgi:hypothetical protein
MNTNEDKYRIMLAGYIDGELSSEEVSELERHLKVCEDCQKELKAFNELKEVTGAMRYADIPEPVWENYWRSIYRRFELGLGWILLSIGVMIMLGFIAWQFIADFILNPVEPLILKIGISALIIGFIILLVAVLRQTLFAHKRDRYSEVKR